MFNPINNYSHDDNGKENALYNWLKNEHPEMFINRPQRPFQFPYTVVEFSPPTTTDIHKKTLIQEQPEDCKELKALKFLRLNYYKLGQKNNARQVTDCIIRKYGKVNV